MLSLTSVIIVVFIAVNVQITTAKIHYKSLNNDTGLMFFDIATNKTILPPIVTPLKYKVSPRLPVIGRPCSCNGLVCGCCAGMNFKQLNFRRQCICV